MADSDQNRSEAATSHKLMKARERGQVAKSRDLSLATVLMAAMVYLSSQGWVVWRTIFEFAQALMNQAGRTDLDPAALWELIDRMIRACASAAVPFLAVVVIAAVLSNLVQIGPLFATAAITPDFERLNPVAGLKRLFSLNSSYQAVRLLLKLVFLAIAVYFALKQLFPQFYLLTGLGAMRQAKMLLDDLAALGLKIGAVFTLLAMADWIISRRRFARRMRMSRREVKDEVKQREGDPRIRSRLRELRRDMLKRSVSLSRTRTADVVITNPVHVAVALRYVDKQMHAPQLVAKGRGVMALAMRKIATRHGIPVVQNPPLARALYREMVIDQTVPAAMYAPVARIIVWVFARRDAAGLRRTGAAAPSRPARRTRG